MSQNWWGVRSLFMRSGWTQEQLAAKEHKSQRWISYRLLFGRFLTFSTNVLNAENAPKNLSECRFRQYWERTGKSGGKVRCRALQDIPSWYPMIWWNA